MNVIGLLERIIRLVFAARNQHQNIAYCRHFPFIANAPFTAALNLFVVTVSPPASSTGMSTWWEDEEWWCWHKNQPGSERMKELDEPAFEPYPYGIDECRDDDLHMPLPNARRGCL